MPHRSLLMGSHLKPLMLRHSRMLKKTSNVVLGSSKSSTYRLRFSEIGNTGGVFPFAKIHCTGERPHEVRSVPPPGSTRLRPCLGQGASRRARDGRVRSLAFLSILRDLLPFLQTCRSVKCWSATTVFPQPVRPLPPLPPYDLIRTVNRPQNSWQG